LNPHGKVSEDEFIRIARTMPPAEAAKYIGVTAPRFFSRRRGIEERRGICLKFQSHSNPEYDAIREIELLNGTIIIGSDAHYWPGQEAPVMHRAMVSLIKKLKPDVVIANGDMCDFPTISRFPHGWESAPTVAQEIETVQDRMDELRKAYKNAKCFWTAGNHDMRLELRIANTMDGLRGLKGIHLKDHIPGWQPCWSVYVNKGLPSWTEIRHRESGGKFAANRNVELSGVTMVTGHLHHACVSWYTDRRGLRYGVQLGMMADSPHDPQFINYLEARVPNWQSAIGVLTYKDGRLLQPELCLKVGNGLAEFRGEVFSV
jgi:hypothetical protein